MAMPRDRSGLVALIAAENPCAVLWNVSLSYEERWRFVMHLRT
jgi:hypothetical protein